MSRVPVFPRYSKPSLVSSAALVLRRVVSGGDGFTVDCCDGREACVVCRAEVNCCEPVLGSFPFLSRSYLMLSISDSAAVFLSIFSLVKACWEKGDFLAAWKPAVLLLLPPVHLLTSVTGVLGSLMSFGMYICDIVLCQDESVMCVGRRRY